MAHQARDRTRTASVEASTIYSPPERASPGGDCVQYRQLGPTDLSVSVIGFGGVPIVRVDPNAAVEVLHRALDLGINFIDTARSYGDSEEKIGLALKGRRDQVIIATKSMARDCTGMEEHIEQSIRSLGTGYIDLYQIHDVREGEMEQIMGPGGAMEALYRARRDGKIGHIGVSGHRPGSVIPAIESGLFETVQLPLNIVDYPLFRDSLPAAAAAGMGVIVMKPLCGGLMESPPEALRFVLSHQAVTSAIPGMATTDEVNANAAVGAGDADLSPQDLARLEEEAKALGRSFCRRCEYCLPCPAGIEIPDIFRFERYKVSYFAGEWAREQYEGLSVSVDDCLDCGECEDRCPYQLPIRRHLERAHRSLLGLDDTD